MVRTGSWCVTSTTRTVRLDDIAGICNAGRNVVGLMPHPERACNELLGSTDGRVMLSSLLASAGARLATAG